ncbi:hypothetical protein JL720_15589 [Aureococcus anophagefferens]|nr:hypothetical protein JL720_15589 [Aureococcus anophagefferens]
MAEEKARAEAALDAILDDAIAEFEEEEDLSQKPEEASEDKVASLLSGDKGSLRVDKALEEKMRDGAMANMDMLVENLRNPSFKDTLSMTLRALSGNEEGVRTIEQFMNDQRLRAENATPSEAPAVELDRSVATTMELLAKSSTDMEGMETAQVEQFGDEMMTNMIAEFERLGQKEDFNQIVENMMRQLLARDLMYEPMKLYQYFQRVVAVYETEPDNFPRLMELLQDLQKYGQVPSDIIKELAPALEFGADGMPVMNMGDNFCPKEGAVPGMPGLPVPDADSAQCSVM